MTTHSSSSDASRTNIQQIRAWFNDRDAIERMQEEIAQELGVSLLTVKYAYYECNMPSVNDALRVEDFRAAIRNTVIAQIRAD